VQTKNWIEAERKLTNLYLSTCDIREKFKDKIGDKWSFDELSVPYKIGDTFYFDFSPADEDNIKIFRFKKPNYYNFESNFLDEAELFFDPKFLKAGDKTLEVDIDKGSFSSDGKYWAFQVTKGGSDWSTIKVREV
jgi:prolyl oligopeptidase